MGYGESKVEPWVLNEEKALPLLEHAYKKGINTWDTVYNNTPPSTMSLNPKANTE